MRERHVASTLAPKLTVKRQNLQHHMKQRTITGVERITVPTANIQFNKFGLDQRSTKYIVIRM